MTLKKDMIDPLDKSAVMEAAAKYLYEDLQDGILMESPEASGEYLTTLLKDEKNEIFMALFLDTRHRLIASEKLFTGTIDGTTVYPRVVAAKALEHNAAALIVAHNHPSGINEPSLADQAITTRLKKALDLFDIRLLDHMIIGKSKPVSMAERGMM